MSSPTWRPEESPLGEAGPAIRRHDTHGRHLGSAEMAFSTLGFLRV